MAFEFEQRFDNVEDDTRLVADLEGEDIRTVLKTWKTNLFQLVAGRQHAKLEKHGFVVVINSSWGAGKTTAVRALVRDLKVKSFGKRTIMSMEYSFLPFGNVNESIADFIHSLSERLWKEHWLDMRTEAKHVIASATPTDDAKYQVGLNAGIFTANIERGWKKPATDGSESRLYDRFKVLAKKKRTVIVTIDDIDRLQAEEMVAILRLVEKLRKLPNLLIIMPVHKTIVANAVRENLGLERQVDAQTFLRKATDAEFSINNTLATLKNVFLDGWEDIDKDTDLIDLMQKDPRAAQSQALQDEGTRSISMLCWYTLLHISILEEAITDIAENSSAGEGNAVTRVFTAEYSEYLTDIKNLLAESRSRKDYIYPVSNDRVDANDTTKRIPTMVSAGQSEEYQPLTEHGAGNVPQHLKLLARKVDYSDKATYTDQGLIDSLKGGSVDNVNQYDETARYILFELFMPRLITTTYEPFITENLHGYYKLRDIKELSQRMRSKIKGLHNKDKGDPHYNIVKLVFKTARESFEEFKR